MTEQRVKVVILGPKKSGKTWLALFIADFMASMDCSVLLTPECLPVEELKRRRSLLNNPEQRKVIHNFMRNLDVLVDEVEMEP